MNWEQYRRNTIGHCSDCAFQFDAYEAPCFFDGKEVLNRNYWGRMSCACADSPLFDKPNPVPERAGCSCWQRNVIDDER